MKRLTVSVIPFLLVGLITVSTFAQKPFEKKLAEIFGKQLNEKGSNETFEFSKEFFVEVLRNEDVFERFKLKRKEDSKFTEEDEKTIGRFVRLVETVFPIGEKVSAPSYLVYDGALAKWAAHENAFVKLSTEEFKGVNRVRSLEINALRKFRKAVRSVEPLWGDKWKIAYIVDGDKCEYWGIGKPPAPGKISEFRAMPNRNSSPCGSPNHPILRFGEAVKGSAYRCSKREQFRAVGFFRKSINVFLKPLTAARLRGKIYLKNSDLPVPGAEVILINLRNKTKSRSCISNGDAGFDLGYLEDGEFEVRIRSDGFSQTIFKVRIRRSTKPILLNLPLEIAI